MSSDMLHELEAIIQARKAEMPAGSYTTSLFEKGAPKIAQKVGEEATEVVVAALAQGRDEQLGELADLFYHVLVLMTELGLTLADVETVLRERHGK
ncbi:MAG: phosphoribosyl-ATP diphosphatase [Chloroflexota bacterium]